MKAIQREFPAANIHGRVTILKPLASARNAMTTVMAMTPKLDITSKEISHLVS